MRHATNKRTDHRIFRQTAAKAKAVNFFRTNLRGGIRL